MDNNMKKLLITLLIICSAVVNADEITIPKDAPSSDAFKKSIINILTRLIPPTKVSDNLELNQFVEESLKSIARANGAKSPALLVHNGSKLSKKYGHFAVFSFLYGHACFLDGKYEKAVEVLKRHYEHVEKSKRFSKLFKVLYSSTLGKSCAKLSIPRTSFTRFARESMSEVIRKKEIGRNQGREVYFFMWHYSASWRTQLSRLKKEKYEPWLINLIEGKIAIGDAWDARGGGWANTVTEEGWLEFKTRLENAYVYLSKAHSVKPESPEAAVLMVVIAMAGYTPPEETVVFWFNQAVKAEFDYMPAYYKLIWALRPRWGGSYKLMLELGEKALSSKRYDTLVPLFYVRALCDIAGDMPGYRWRSVFMNSENQQKMGLLFKNLASQENYQVHSDTLLAMQMHIALFGGDYSIAQELYNRVPQGFDFEKTFKLLFINEDFPLNKALIERELRVGVTFEKELKNIYTLTNQADRKSAIKCIEQLLSQLDKDDIYGREFLLNEIAYTALGVSKEKVPRAFTGLRACVKNKNFELFQRLLDLGAPLIPVDDSMSFNILDSITRYSDGDSRYLAAALTKEVDLNTSNYDGWTPLHNSVRYGSLEEVKLLVGAGAALNARTNYRHTPLHYAAWHRDVAFAKVLIDAGADPDCKNNQGLTPLIRAIKEERPVELISYLIKESNQNVTTDSGKNALYYAARHKMPSAIMQLIEQGAKVEHKNNKGWTALHSAARYGDAEAVNALLQHKADVETRTDYDSTPLILAASNNSLKVVETLVKAGSDVNAVDRNGKSCLIKAVLTKKPIEFAEFLVENEADINLCDNDRKSALHHAVDQLNLPYVELFLKNRVSVVSSNDMGKFKQILSKKENKHNSAELQKIKKIILGAGQK